MSIYRFAWGTNIDEDSGIPKSVATFRPDCREIDLIEEEDDKKLVCHKREDGRFGGISLFSNVRQHSKRTLVDSLEDVRNTRGNGKFYMLLKDNEKSVTKIKDILKDAKKAKTLDQRSIKVQVCYVLDRNLLPSEFAIQQDPDDHYTLHPTSQCSCDYVMGEESLGQTRYGNLSLLRCGAWIGHCILFDAGGEPVDFRDDFDRDLWEGCMSLFIYWKYEMEDNEEDSRLISDMICFFNIHKYRRSEAVQHLHQEDVESWIRLVEEHLPMISDYEDVDRIRDFNSALNDMKRKIIRFARLRSCESVHLIVHGVNFAEEQDKQEKRNSPVLNKDRRKKEKGNQPQSWQEVDWNKMVNIMKAKRNNNLLRGWNGLFDILSNCRPNEILCARGSVVVDIRGSATTAIQLKLLLDEDKDFCTDFIQTMAEVMGYTFGDCNLVGYSLENWMNEKLEIEHNIVPQKSCRTFCALFKTSPFSKEKGTEFCVGVSSVITLLKCNAWNKSHQRCMLLCFNKDVPAFLGNIYSCTTDRVPPKWKKRMLSELKSCHLLQGLQFSTHLTHPVENYMILVTFDNSSEFQNNAREVVLDSFNHMGFECYDEANFEFDCE